MSAAQSSAKTQSDTPKPLALWYRKDWSYLVNEVIGMQKEWPDLRASGNSTGRQEPPNQTNNPLSQETRGSGSTDNVVDSIGSQLQQQSANSGFGGRLFNFGASTSGFG